MCPQPPLLSTLLLLVSQSLSLSHCHCHHPSSLVLNLVCPIPFLPSHSRNSIRISQLAHFFLFFLFSFSCFFSTVFLFILLFFLCHLLPFSSSLLVVLVAVNSVSSLPSFSLSLLPVPPLHTTASLSFCRYFLIRYPSSPLHPSSPFSSFQLLNHHHLILIPTLLLSLSFAIYTSLITHSLSSLTHISIYMR